MADGMTGSSGFSSLIVAAGFVIASASTAHAVIVSTQYVNRNEGTADFGSGLHVAGFPTGNGVVTFDFGTSGGRLMATARVRGTLYWDSLFGSGCARLRLEFFSPRFVGVMATRQITECGPGGNANLSTNQTVVDETFSDPFVEAVRIAVFDAAGSVGAQVVITAPRVRTYAPTFETGAAKFEPVPAWLIFQAQLAAPVRFERTFDAMAITMTGNLKWNSLTRSCARLITDFQDIGGAALRSVNNDTCGNGVDLPALRGVGESFEAGALFRVRLRLGTLIGGRLLNIVGQTFDFNGPTGNFEIAPAESTVEVDEPFGVAFTWTVPEPKNWHDLESLHLRITEGTDAILWVKFDEASNTFSVFNAASGRFGRGEEAGSPNRLQTPHATLHLSAASVAAVNSVLGTGANSPGVTVNLPLTFKPSAAGRTYTVEVAASDDEGNADPFVVAGTLTVLPKQP